MLEPDCVLECLAGLKIDEASVLSRLATHLRPLRWDQARRINADELQPGGPQQAPDFVHEEQMYDMLCGHYDQSFLDELGEIE